MSTHVRYGFKSTPKLELVARPKLGKRAVTFSQITHWIERKLCSLVDVSTFYTQFNLQMHLKFIISM